MENKSIEMDLTKWFSTYGVLTSKRIFDRFNIELDNNQLIAVINNPNSIYYRLLRIPIKNVFNGIILQQAHDYQIYAQKLFIDYLLSGESGGAEDSPGANLRESIELERVRLVEMTANFHALEMSHQTVIAASQSSLITLAAHFQDQLVHATKKTKQTLNRLGVVKDERLINSAICSSIIAYTDQDKKIFSSSSAFWLKMAALLEVDLERDVKEELAIALDEIDKANRKLDAILAMYLEKTNDITKQLRQFRSQFQRLILQATTYIQSLPDYHMDQNKKAENQSALLFDSEIGEH